MTTMTITTRLSRTASILGLCAGLLFGAIAQAQSKATLYFKGTDIHEVIEAVSNVTGKNFVIDPRVKGKVTIISSRSMNADEIYQVFLTVLEVHGFSAVPSGNVYQIIPSANAKQGPVKTITEGSTRASSEIVTRVFHVDNVPATQLVPILRPLLPQQAHMAAYQPTNSLIISDRADNVLRLEKIIESIDQPSLAEAEVVQLEHASAGEVVRILTTMEKGQAAGAAKADAPTFIADERTNSILLAGDTAWRSRIRQLIDHLDKPLGIETGNTHVLYLRYAKAEDLTKVLTGVSEAENKVAEKAKPAASSSDRVSIQADAGTNSLVITAPPEQLRTLRAVVSKLDVPRAQVMVEAIIAEISDDKVRQLGVQWLFDGVSNGSGSPTGVINFSAGNSIASLASGVATGIPDVGNGLNLALGSVGSGGSDIAGILQAFSGDSGVNVLSTPSILTLDNQEAEITVGEERPFVTGSFTGTGSNTPTNPFTTVNREQVGLTLKVTPQINEGSAVRMDIEQEISSVIPGSEGDYGPATTNRALKTSVLVEDGKLLVLGGLIDDQIQETEQRVPILGSIPVVGWLFKYKQSTKQKRNLMIFLKPTILRNSLQSTLASSEKYNYIRLQQFAAREEMNSLLSRSEAPVLEDLDKYLSLPPTFEDYMRNQQQKGTSADGDDNG
ncbi:MAG: type II secretion system secretin GspD [Gammaproteobacteria bacterium]|nr:type II secretion system secretin GspD [Gammaproteobacteria bacterium]